MGDVNVVTADLIYDYGFMSVNDQIVSILITS